jgi:hypothetical protein
VASALLGMVHMNSLLLLPLYACGGSFKRLQDVEIEEVYL